MDPQRPDWSSHVQHTTDCSDPSYFSVVAHLSHSALLHFCFRQNDYSHTDPEQAIRLACVLLVPG